MRFAQNAQKNNEVMRKISRKTGVERLYEQAIILKLDRLFTIILPHKITKVNAFWPYVNCFAKYIEISCII